MADTLIINGSSQTLVVGIAGPQGPLAADGARTSQPNTFTASQTFQAKTIFGAYEIWPLGPFNVRYYGAQGDGVTDDTAAFQAAFDAAVAVNGQVIIPPANAGQAYLLSAPVVIQPGGSTGNGSGQCRLRVECGGNYQAIQWRGPNNSSVFVLHGVKDSLFHNVNILLATAAAGVVVWDCQPTAAAGSMSNVRWHRCRVTFGTGGNNVAWRTGQSTPISGLSDHAEFLWDHCVIAGGGKTLGDIGWQIGGSQTIPQLFLHCSGSSLWCLYLSGAVACLSTATINATDTTLNVDDTSGFNPTGTLQISGSSEQITYTGLTATTFTGCVRGANGTTAATSVGTGYVVNQFETNVPGGVANVGVYVGGEALTWIGGGGSSNANDFRVSNGGRYDVMGFRGETGARFFRSSTGNTSGDHVVTFWGCELASYTPPADGACFLLKSNCQLTIANCSITGNPTPFTAAWITEAGGGAFGCIDVSNSVIAAADPFYTLSAGHLNSWQVVIDRVALMSGAGVVTGFATSPVRNRTVQALVYGATVTPNPRLGEYMTLSVTNGTAFTINAPATNPSGAPITFEVTNNSGGVLGAVTWASGTNGYRLAGAWVSPASGTTRTISFVYNGTKWVEVSRAVADIA